MDRFRPNLPLDPFEQMEPHFGRAAWLLDADQLDRFAAQSTAQRDVVLIIGEPSPESLRPLLTSAHLASSLLIIATSNAYDTQTLCPQEWTRPSVRILRLETPMAVQDGGGSRFLHLLDWAERVARVWRLGPKTQSIVEHSEHDHDLVPTQPLSQKASDSSMRSAWLTPPSLHGHGSPASSPRTSVVFSEESNGSSSSLPVPTSYRPPKHARRPSTLPHADPRQRPFDALISFLPPPSVLSPKGLLKQAIMVTTLSRPYLTVPVAAPRGNAPRTVSQAGSSSRKRSSSTSTPGVEHRRSSTLNPDRSPPSTSSTPGATTPTRPRSSYFPPQFQPQARTDRAAHIVHVVPPFGDAHAHAALVRALEAFILNFSDAGLAEREERARPFVIDDARLGEPVREGWAVVAALLAGALDAGGRALERRAWLAGAADVQTRTAPPTPATTRSVKGKARAGAETALPSPPPSPPQVPAMTLTPPSATEPRPPPLALPAAALALTPESESEKPGAPRRRQSGSSAEGGGCLGGSKRASRSETALAEKHKVKKRWWWPFASKSAKA